MREVEDGLRRRRQRRGQAIAGLQIHSGHARAVAGWSEPDDASVRALRVAHAVPADRRVVPVRDEHGPVGRDRDIRGPEPRIVAAVDDLVDAGGVAGAGRRQRVAGQHAPAGFGVEQVTAVAFGQQRAFVDDEPARRARTEPHQVGEDARQLLVEVTARILAPRPAVRSAKPVVAPLDDVVRPRPLVPVIVVVRLPDVAERVERQLVRVPEVLREHLQAGAVRVHHHDDAFEELTGPEAHRGRARAAWPRRTQASSGPVCDVEAFVAGVEVVPSVGTEDDRMEPVVVVDATPAGEQHLFLDDSIARVLGVDGEVRRLRDDHAVPEHRDAQGRADLRALVEHGALVRPAVTVHVFENDDAIPFGPDVGLLAQARGGS